MKSTNARTFLTVFAAVLLASVVVQTVGRYAPSKRSLVPACLDSDAPAFERL